VWLVLYCISLARIEEASHDAEKESDNLDKSSLPAGGRGDYGIM